MKLLLLLLSASVISPAFAGDIAMVGAFPGKALLVVDNASPKIYAVGQQITPDTALVAVDSDSAIISENGKRRTLPMGSHIGHRPSSAANAVLHADGSGHFLAQVQINGGTMRTLVDTGATLVALPAADATRLGINYRSGTPIFVNTANGAVRAYQVTLDSIKLGDMELNQVAAVVQESGLPIGLLGMSFLNRMEMRRSGDEMILSKRF